MNKYIYFLKNYSALDNTYTWFYKVRYAIQKSDNDNYYIFGNSKQLYPIPKSLEFEIYTVEENNQDKIN